MILNEAVTLLGYKVDERELERYKKQLRQQEAEALKLLNQREARAKLAEREKLAAAQRAANEQARIAARAANAQIREAQRSQRAQERALAAQTRAHERAQAKMARDTARRLEREKKDALAHLRGSGAGMGGLGMLGGALSVGGLAAGAKSVYDTGTSRESMLTGLKNLPGMNESSALREFKRLQEFNTKTPFGLDEITSSYIRLRNMGLNASNEAMTAYGGIAASIPGKKINDFVEAVADGVMGEAERLKEFGIKMKVEGDKAAITFRGQTIKVARDAKSIERALMDIGTKNFGNTMADLAKTTGGQMSNLTDQIEDLKWQIWQGGMKQAVGELIKGSSKLLKQWMPIAREFAIVQRLNMPRYLKMVGDALPLINLGLGIMLARMTGLKMLAMAEWATKTAMAFKTLGAAQFFLNGGLGIMPTLIGGATLALGALIGDFVYFMTTGDSMLLKFTERWPVLNNWLKNAYEMNKIFWTAVQIGIERSARYMKDFTINYFGKWFNDMKTIWTWLEEKLPWLINSMKTLGNVVSNGIGGAMNWALEGIAGAGMRMEDRGGSGGSGGGGTPSTFGIDTLTDNKKAADFARNARNVVSKAGYCLNAVWQIHEKTLGKGKAWSTTVTHAYLAAEKLAQDKRFKEIKGVTPEMLQSKDPAVMRMLHGATIIYDRGAGFSSRTAESGHAEVLDMVNKTVRFGTGPVPVSTRNQHHMNHGRVFVPVQQQPMPVPANRSNQVSSLPPIMIEQNFNGQVSPAQVRGASNAGVQQGLHRASLSAAQGMA